MRRHDKSVTLPKGINIVADLDYSKFINNGISVSDIQSSIGNKVSTTVTNGIITLDISTVDDNDVQALVRYNWCTYVIPSTIMKYKKELMSTYDVTGTDWALDIAIEESVLECTPNLCLDCADSECVINKLINHPQISVSSAIVRDIKINYLRLLLDLSDEQIEWLKDNPSILEDLFNTYELNFNGKDGSSTRSIGCDMNICGAEGAANAHINLLMNDIELNEEEAGNLCDFYTELYNSNKGSYNCLVGEGDLVAQMSIAEFGSTAPIYTILNESGIENSCQPFGKYVPCSEVVFSNPQPPTNKRICQIEIKMALNTLLCIPPVSESEGILQNLDMSLKVEFRIPDFAFSGMFGYENNQTIVATLLSDAVQYVWNLVEADISCSNAVSKKGDFINYFFDFIKDSDVLTQSYYWGQTGFSVEVLENFQIFVPDYENSSTELYWDRSVIKCN